MKWIEIDKDNLPDGEVLAANFEEGSDGYREKMIGNLLLELKTLISCYNYHEQLENCTHYIDIHKFDIV